MEDERRRINEQVPRIIGWVEEQNRIMAELAEGACLEKTTAGARLGRGKGKGNEK